MKKIALFTALMTLLVMSLAYSQEEKPGEDLQTIFTHKGGKISHGGYAAITTGYSQIAGKDAFTLGGRAGWLIDHHFTIGLAGNALVNSIYVNSYDFPPDYSGDPIDGLYLVGGYGGLFVEPIIAPNFPIHVAIPILIGGGGAASRAATFSKGISSSSSFSMFSDHCSLIAS